MIERGNRRTRRIGVLALSAVSALTLTACGGGGDGAAAGSNGFTFAFENASGGQASPWQVVADQYSQETGVKIDTQGLPPDSYGLTVRTQLQGGNAPDLMMFSPGSGNVNAVLPLAKAGYIEPLSEASTAIIPKGNEGLFTLDGKTYAQPTDIVPVGMVWNNGASTQAGVSVPTSAGALLGDCRAAAGKGKSVFAVAGSASQNLGLMTMAISATRVYAATPDWNQQRAANTVTFAGSKGWQDTLQTIVDMKNAGCFQEGVAGGGFDAITQGLTQGTSMAAFVPGAAATELAKATPGLELQVQAFPPADGGKPFMLASPNYALSVNAKAADPQKQAAEKFLAWLAQPANAAKFTEIQGGIPITGASGGDLPATYAPVADLLKSSSFAPLPTLDWPNPSVYDSLSTGVQGLIAGQGDIPSVLKAVDQAWAQ